MATNYGLPNPQNCQFKKQLYVHLVYCKFSPSYFLQQKKPLKIWNDSKQISIPNLCIVIELGISIEMIKGNLILQVFPFIMGFP